MKQLSERERALLVESYKTTGSYVCTARKYKTTSKSVAKWVKRDQKIGNLSTKTNKGRKRKLSEEATSAALKMLLSNTSGGIENITQELVDKGLCTERVSATTLSRSVKRAAVNAGTPIKTQRGPPPKSITEANKKKRLAFAASNSRTSWSKVLFTDRKSFLFKYPGSQVHPVTWVYRGRECKPSAGVYTPNHPRKFNVYGGISKTGVTDLYEVGQEVEGTRFKTARGKEARSICKEEYEHILNVCLLKNGQGIMPGRWKNDFLLQQDGDPAHNSADVIIEKYNSDHDCAIKMLENWPPNSPDLNLIENVWAWVDAEVSKLGCSTFEEYKQAVRDTFGSITKQHLGHLYDSMTDRIKAVIINQGEKTRY